MEMTGRKNKAASLAGWLSRRGLPVGGRFCARVLALILAPALGFVSAPSLLALGAHGHGQTSHAAPPPAPHPSAPAPQAAPRPAPQAAPRSMPQVRAMPPQNHPNASAPH